MTDKKVVGCLKYFLIKIQGREFILLPPSERGLLIDTLEDAIALINSQQAHIVELKHEREISIEDIHHSADQINEQLEEIERLQNDLAISRKETKRYATRRAEAIKEFAERLKEIYQNIPTLWGTVAVKCIDNLVKEMVGEQE